MLLPHTRKLVDNLLGWKRADGTRLYRKCYFSVARKNAKTQILAAIALYLLCMDDEQKPEIYMAARDRDQAALCYSAARDMVYAAPELRAILKVTEYHRRIENRMNGGIMRAVSSEGKSKHGYNPSAVIFDELHAWSASEQELYDALTTGSGARRQPLQLMITTAGHDSLSICGREYEYAKAILDRTIEDTTYLPIIYEVPRDADWTDEALWPLANPALDTIVSRQFLREECAKAKARPAEQNKFRRLYLNQWTEANEAWIPLIEWDQCGDEVPLEDLESVPCFGGLDLGATRDLTSFVLVWPYEGKYFVKPWFYIPEEGLRERGQRDNVPYPLWAQQGHIRLTPGAVTDWRFVTAHIKELRGQFNIQAVAFDRAGARDTAADLKDDGLEVLDFGQGFMSMSPAAKRLEELVYARQLVHGGHPVLRWNCGCTTIANDPAGNIKPVKPSRLKDTKRIDGIVAACMALGICMQQPTMEPPRIWVC